MQQHSKQAVSIINKKRGLSETLVLRLLWAWAVLHETQASQTGATSIPPAGSEGVNP